MPHGELPAVAALKTGVFIGNEWRSAASGECLDVINPSTGVAFTSIAAGAERDVDRAVAEARRAFETGDWGRLSATDRGRILGRFSRLIQDDIDLLSHIEALDTGKPMKTARADVAATARYFEYYAGAADKLHGETIPYLPGFSVATFREPLGVTAHIIPWNYPIQMFGRTVAPALAAGNAVVVKPAEDACLGVMRLVELAVEAGLPPGALNVVPGTGAQAGAALSAHPDIDFIAFTGSPEVGVLIQTAAAKNHVACTLELGGKSPHIVFGDADLDAATAAIANGIIYNAGQTCSAGSRVLIERRAFDAVIERMADRFSRAVAGTPEMDLALGPVISAKQMARVESFNVRATEESVPVLARGQIAEGVPPGGFFVAPTLYGPVPRANRLANVEVFGPTLAVLPFEDEGDAIQLANNTPFALMAAVWSRDGSRNLRVAHAVRAGQVYINGFGAGGGVELPFGGMKKSGHGREKGFEALYEYSTVKTVITQHG